MNEEITDILKSIALSLKGIESNLSNAKKVEHCDFDRHVAFTWRNVHGAYSFHPVKHPSRIDLDDILEVDQQKEVIVRNTEQFLAGHPANNILLWGAKGTGKSSLTRAILHRYKDQGLRIVEVDRSDIIHISDITETLRKSDKKFILLCDDLSFESEDVSYKSLKTFLDGGISSIPENVIIYATSNRRHLMPEMMSDNLETKIVNDEIHYGDAVEEKISLSERFGIWISFYPFDKGNFLKITRHWVEKFELEFTEEIAKSALLWSQTRASKSGRCAYQFAVTLHGKHHSSKVSG